MKTIYFIGSNLQESSRMIETLNAYCTDLGIECRFSLLFINLKEQDRSNSIQYYESLFVHMNADICEVRNINDLIPIIKSIPIGNDFVIIINICMYDNGMDIMESSAGFKCTSMKCLDIIEDAGLKYVLCSNKWDNDYKHEWENKYRELYKKDFGIIYQREDLTLMHFKQSVADMILGVNNSD